MERDNGRPMVQEIIEVVCRTIQANRSTTDAIGGSIGLVLSMRGGALLLKGAAVASFTLLALSPNASARMRCSYSGAPQNLLTVTADRAALGEIVGAQGLGPLGEGRRGGLLALR